MFQNYFIDEGAGMSWSICFKEYDKAGILSSLISCKANRIKHKWKEIDKFLSSCPKDCIREIFFRRNGKNYPSIITDGTERRFSAPIQAKLPLFEYAAKLEFVAA